MSNYSYVEHTPHGDYEIVIDEQAAIEYSKASAQRYLNDNLERIDEINKVLSEYTDESYLQDFIVTHWATLTDKEVGEYKL